MSQDVWGEKETRFFYELSPEHILDAVEKEGLPTTGRCLQLNSMENRVYEVELDLDDLPTTSSERYRIAKFYRPGRWSNEQILEEHEFLLQLRELELPVVAPIIFKDNSTLQKIEANGSRFALFHKIGGRSPDELNEEQLQQVGRLLGRLHRIGETKEATHRLQLTPEIYGYHNLDFMLEAEILPEPIESRYQQLVEQICEIAEPWFEATPVHRIHGDCHLGNLLWNANGLMLVDFDDMVVGPAVQDFWMLIQGRDEYARAKLDTLLHGYSQMHEFDRSTLRLIEPLRALRMVHISAWIARRYGDPSFKRAFPDFGSDRYWQEELSALSEQLELLQSETALTS